MDTIISAEIPEQRLQNFIMLFFRDAFLEQNEDHRIVIMRIHVNSTNTAAIDMRIISAAFKDGVDDMDAATTFSSEKKTKKKKESLLSFTKHAEEGDVATSQTLHISYFLHYRMDQKDELSEYVL